MRHLPPDRRPGAVDGRRSTVTARARSAILCAAALVAPAAAAAQGWRVRLDANAQSVSYRGWQMDSIPSGSVVSGPGGGPTTPDGYAVACDGGAYCVFFRPGGRQASTPGVVDADATMWGLGVAGL